MSAIRAGYKQTEVGVIPDDWKVTTLGDICEFENGDRSSNYPSGDDFTTSGIPFVNAGHVADGKIAFVAMDYITSGSFARLTRGKIKSGDILYCLRGSLGKFGIADDGFGEGAIASSLVIVRPKKSAALRQYLLCYFGSGLCAKMIETWAGGAAQPNLGVQDLARFSLALPQTSEEQEAIAGALSDANALVESLELLLAKKRHLKQGAMHELLTGNKRLPGFSGEWANVCMRDVLLQSATYGIVTAGAFVQNGVKMVRGGDIVDGRVNTDLPMVSREKAAEYSRTTLVKDDVVIALVGYPGASSKIPDELIGANISRAVGILRLNSKVLPDYLVCFLDSPDGRRMVLAPSAGSAQQVVNLAALNKLEFCLPPLEEQHAVASMLLSIDAEITELESELAKTRALKQGMMQKLLTGEIRLIPATVGNPR